VCNVGIGKDMRTMFLVARAAGQPRS